MKNHLELLDNEFETAFRNCELPPSVFSHEAHLRLAWIHISKYGVDNAIINIQKQLQNYVAFAGASNKYNATLTVAAIKAVYHFMRKSNSKSFKGFIVEFPQLKNDFRRLMDCHYGFDIFHSNLAKKKYLEPDLLPFD
ncbi:hypothetical protein ACJD0Z_17750 [Flavobacteriaceae bacterium M23B6Z8]